MSDKRLNIVGSSLVGVFARCTEQVVLVPYEVGPEDMEMLQTGLKVDGDAVTDRRGLRLGVSDLCQ